jgi:ribose transport system permease protein
MALHGLTRILGITLLLAAIAVITTIQNPYFADAENLSNLLRWTALFGILALGVAFVIITGGIDLSIGSVVALTGIVLMQLLQVTYYDSGERLTIAALDQERSAIVFEQALPDVAHLDQLAIANPSGGPDLLLTIDVESAVNNVEAKTLLVNNSVRRLTIGSETKLLRQSYMNPTLAIGIVLLIGVGLGALHGVLIGYANLQPFIVTLCGLMGYRGLARLVSNDRPLGVGEHHEAARYLAAGEPMHVPVPMINAISGGDAAGSVGWVAVPMPLLIFLVLAVLSAIMLHKTVLGRYLLAMGRNEEAARFSGIDTRKMTLLAYVLCSLLASLGGILFALELNSVQPSSQGNFYELYAIAAAVLGGCSLRGGVGSIAGVVVGTLVIRSLYNAINLMDKPTYWQAIIIGVVLLAGVMFDEIGRQVVKRVKTRRRKKMLSG